MTFKPKSIRRKLIKLYLFSGRVFEKLKNLVAGSELERPVKANLPAEGEIFSLAGKVVLITGSYRGIGLSLAEGFLKEGAWVVINGRNKEGLSKSLKKLREKYENVTAVASDISSSHGAALLIEESLNNFSKIDILINNAGIAGPDKKRIWDVSEQEFASVLNINVTGAFLCSKLAINWSRENNHPVRIINVSSGIVGHGSPYLSPYMVSKSALEGLTLAIEEDCGDEDNLITAVSVRPRSVMTDMTGSFYSKTEYGLLDDPDVLVPAFIFAATSHPHEIMGKNISEPKYQQDPAGEPLLSSNVSAVSASIIEPETFKPENTAPTVDRSGAYMHLLQNPFRMSPGASEALMRAASDPDMHGYPDPRLTDLRAHLSRQLNISPDGIVFGAGSSELLERALRTFSTNKGQVIVTRPTWGAIIWSALAYCGMTPVEVPYKGSLQTGDIMHDLDGIHARITSKTRLVYLVNPCNPTGSIVDKDKLKDFLLSMPRNMVVLLDEAYFDFCEPEKRFHLAKHLDRIKCHVIGFRTFSKFFALSGFRIGYAYSRPETAGFLTRLGLNFNISNIAQSVALAALRDEKFQRQVYQNNYDERNLILETLKKNNISCMPTQSNFLLFDCPVERSRMRADLRKNGIFMPNVDGAFEISQNYAITSIGLPEHNRTIIDYLSRF